MAYSLGILMKTFFTDVRMLFILPVATRKMDRTLNTATTSNTMRIANQLLDLRGFTSVTGFTMGTVVVVVTEGVVPESSVVVVVTTGS